MAAWVKEEENASNQRQKKREAEEADKVEVAPRVTVASLRRFRAALIGPTQGLPTSEFFFTSRPRTGLATRTVLVRWTLDFGMDS